MAVDLFANAANTTLSAGIAAGATSLTVASSTPFPAVTTAAATQFRVIVDSELFIVTNVAGLTWTVTPGAEGTTQAAHASGVTVTVLLTAGALTLRALTLVPVAVKTTSYTANVSELVPVNVTSGAATVSLPAAPFTGATVGVYKTDSSANILTILPAGGGTINGDPNATTATKNGGATFEHLGSNAWAIVAAYLTTGPAGPTGSTGPQGPTGTGATGAAGTNGAISLIQGQGTALTVRSTLNFVGAGVTSTDDAANSRTLITIPGGGGGGGGAFSIRPATGRFFLPSDGATTFSSVTVASGTIYWRPMTVDTSATVTSLTVDVVTNGSNNGVGNVTSSSLALLIAADLNGKPDTLLINFGQANGGAVGQQSKTGTYAMTAGTRYWLGVVQQGAPAVSAALTGTNAYVLETALGASALNFLFNGSSGEVGFTELGAATTVPTARAALTSNTKGVSLPLVAVGF